MRNPSYAPHFLGVWGWSRASARAGVGLIAAVLGAELLRAASPDYTIQTIAGSTADGDGLPSNEAFVSVLEGVCADAAGNIYVADADDNRVRKIDSAGMVTTVAGNGTPGFGGDGGPATQAYLRSPYGIRLDANGNLFIADLGNNRIREVTPDGTISTFVEGLIAPRNLAFDSSGNLFVSEFGAHRVDQVMPDGSVILFAGSGTAGFAGDGGAASSAQLNSPAAIAFDAAGAMLIADSANQRIRKVAKDGTISTAFSDPNLLEGVTGLAIDAAGNLFVGAEGTAGMFRVDTEGAVHSLLSSGHDLFLSPLGPLLAVAEQHLTRINADGSSDIFFDNHSFGDGGPALNARLESVADVAVNRQGNVVIADDRFHRLRLVAPSGLIFSVASTKFMTGPSAVAFDPSGKLFVADAGAIDRQDANGLLETFAGNLFGPSALAVDKQGNLVFADRGVVYQADPNGNKTAVAGGLGAPPLQQLNQPMGIAVDGNGTIFVADTGNNLIRKVQADGSFATVAGDGTPDFTGDEGPAAAARLSAPHGIAFDASGNLWIADTGNNRVRYIDSAGVIHTAAGSGQAGFGGDNGPASLALFNAPTSVACDAGGNVYIGDSGNRRVRVLRPGADGEPSSLIFAITNAATYQAGPVVAGSIVSLFGQSLGPQNGVSGQLASSGNLATTLAGTEVLFNGIAAPLFYAGATQINLQVPVEVASARAVAIELRRDGRIGASAAVDIAPVGPGLFALNGNAAALNQDGSVNSSAQPATAGSVVVLFGTGFGATQPAEVTGVPAAAVPPISTAPISVLIGGVSAQVLFAGDAPGFVGLTQINVRVPLELAGAGTVAVDVFASGISSGSSPQIFVQ